MNKESVTLYYRKGSSDKVYRADLQPKEGGFVVNFAFGRRGSTLTTGCKTPDPVPFQKAKAIYDKLVKSKTAKGYTPGEDGTPYRNTDKEERSTGFLPQLLNPVSESEAKCLIDDPDWWMQEKIDGRRVLVEKVGNRIVGINRKGLTISLPESIVKDALDLGGDFVLDGECVGERYHAFDLLARHGTDIRQRPYLFRFVELGSMIARRTAAMQIVRTATSGDGKRDLYSKLRQEKQEGVVFKQCSAPYTEGRPASGGTQLKYKFVATASVMVEKVNARKHSVAVAVFDEKDKVPVGNVTIPQKTALPEDGSIIDVEYLYAYPGGSLYQPVYRGIRDDLAMNDCCLGQLKYKAGSRGDES